ncbi:MAG: hypothetical protein RL173_1466 [Fibrobacterota bacterium]
MQSSRPLSRRILAACALLGVALVCLTGCDRSNDSNSGDVAGVAGTGNAGRVAGVVRLADLGVQADTRLLRVEAGRSMLVSSRPTDSAGVFVYDSIPTGTYTVEAWQGGLLAGRSAEFVVTKVTSQIVIVLVKPVFVHLDLRALGNVDSAYLDYPGNPVLKSDSLWTLRDVAVDSIGYNATLFTKVANGTGSGVWLSWKLANVGGRLELAGLVQGPVATIHSVDSGSYYPTRNTMALWTFDSITPDGRIKDLSPHRNDLALTYGGYLVSSPHGSALDFTRLPVYASIRLAKDSLPTNLQWWKSDYQTFRMRIKVGEPLKQAYQIFGSTHGLNVEITPDRQLHLSISSGNELEYFHYEYRSFPELIEIGTWTEIAITIDAKQNAIALWKNGIPAHVFAMHEVTAQYLKVARDTIVFTGIGAGNLRGPLAIDEMEISDTALPGPMKISQPISGECFGHYRTEFVSFGFNVASETDSALSMDTSELVDLGGVKSLYFKVIDSTKLALSEVVYSSLYIDLAEETTNPQRFAAYEAYSSFESKIARNIAPIAGIDYSSTPIGIATTEGLVLKWTLTTLAARWATDPRTNHGVVIQAVDKSQPAQSFKLQHNPNPPSPHLFVYFK